MTITGKTSTSYRGQRIVRCNWETGQHGGEWYIQSYHRMAWADEACPHYSSITAAKEAIKAEYDYLSEYERRA